MRFSGIQPLTNILYPILRNLQISHPTGAYIFKRPRPQSETSRNEDEDSWWNINRRGLCRPACELSSAQLAQALTRGEVLQATALAFDRQQRLRLDLNGHPAYMSTTTAPTA